MQFTSETEVMVYYDRAYVPARHAGDKHRNTRSVVRADLRTLQRIVVAIDERDGEPPRKLTLGILSDDLLKEAMAYRVNDDKVAAPTANKLYRHTRSVWALAAQRGILAKGPSPEEKPYKELLREPQCWPQADWFKILAAAKELPGWIGGVKAGDWFTALLWFVYATGARISACMYTPSANLDCECKTVLVPAAYQKQGADQLLDLVDEAMTAIAKIGAAERGLKHLFDDWPFDRSVEQWHALNGLLKTVLIAAGLFSATEEVTRYDLWHKIRRTFATFVAAKGGEALAMALLGHSHVRVTRRYLDKRFIERPSARGVLPVPEPADPAPPPLALAPGPQLCIYHGEAV